MKYTPDPHRTDEYRESLRQKFIGGVINHDRYNDYLIYLFSGGQRFPDRIMDMPPGRPKEDAKREFRQRFRKQAGDDWHGGISKKKEGGGGEKRKKTRVGEDTAQ